MNKATGNEIAFASRMPETLYVYDAIERGETNNADHNWFIGDAKIDRISDDIEVVARYQLVGFERIVRGPSAVPIEIPQKTAKKKGASR